MKPLTCPAALRRLHAFYDGELAVPEQIAVEAHLDGCETCVSTLAELRAVSASLRLGAPSRALASQEESSTFVGAVMSRRQAEQEASFLACVRDLFEDMHLVYAGVGAAAATIACIVIMFGMMRYATVERPDSLAAMVSLLATPESSANSIAIDAASHQRWTERFQAASESAEEDTVFALEAMVTRDGQLADIERLKKNRRRAGREEANLIEGLLDAVTRARIEPGSMDATGSAANAMVWLVTRTTVRATRAFSTDLPLPAPGKKASSVRI